MSSNDIQFLARCLEQWKVIPPCTWIHDRTEPVFFRVGDNDCAWYDVEVFKENAAGEPRAIYAWNYRDPLDGVMHAFIYPRGEVFRKPVDAVRAYWGRRQAAARVYEDSNVPVPGARTFAGR